MKLWAVLALIGFGLSSAFAQTKPAPKNAADAERKIESLRKEIKTLTKAQRELEEKRNREALQLRQIDQKVAQSSQSLTKVEQQIGQQTRRLESLEDQQARLEDALRQQKQELAMCFTTSLSLWLELLLTLR